MKKLFYFEFWPTRKLTRNMSVNNEQGFIVTHIFFQRTKSANLNADDLWRLIFVHKRRSLILSKAFRICISAWCTCCRCSNLLPETLWLRCRMSDHDWQYVKCNVHYAVKYPISNMQYHIGNIQSNIVNNQYHIGNMQRSNSLLLGTPWSHSGVWSPPVIDRCRSFIFSMSAKF